MSNGENDVQIRTIEKIDNLFDVGPVTYPAYLDTTVALRSLDAHREADVTRMASNEPPIQPKDEPVVKQEEKQEEEPKYIGPVRQKQMDRKLNRLKLAIEKHKPAETPKE